MSIADYGLSDAGYTAPRQADYLEAIRDRFDAELTALGFTELPDYARDTYLGNITEIMAYMLGQLSEATQAVYDARSVANATGLQLSNLALIVGVTRNPATYSTVTLTCTGTEGTAILEGRIVEGGGDDGRARWIITEDAVIPVSGSVDVTARAEELGQVVASAAEIDTIVTPLEGWTGVTNAAAATPGSDRETDAELRARRQRALAAAGSTSTNAILSALLDLDDVSSAVVLDNKTGVDVTTDGVDIDAYSVACIVAPDTITDATKALVVQAIYEHVGGGTAMSGDQTGEVEKRDGRTETVRYYLATAANVTLVWVLVLDTGYEVGDVSDALEEAVSDYFLTLACGATVYPTPLIALAAAIDGIKNVTTLTINGTATPKTFNANQLPTLVTPMSVS